MNMICITEVPGSKDIPLEARQELLGKKVPFRGSGPAGGVFMVDIFDLFDAVGDEIPKLQGWLRKNVQPLAGAMIEIEEHICEQV